MLDRHLEPDHEFPLSFWNEAEESVHNYKFHWDWMDHMKQVVHWHHSANDELKELWWEVHEEIPEDETEE